LLKKEAMRKIRGLIEDVVDQTFFITHVRGKMGRRSNGNGLMKKQKKEKANY
jgi:hypothetical protein